MARLNKIQIEDKYVSRCHYSGKLIKMERTEAQKNLVLTLLCRVATPYYDKNVKVRIYVPQAVEPYLNYSLVIGSEYFVVCAPYASNFKGYRHRVDMLLNMYRK